MVVASAPATISPMMVVSSDLEFVDNLSFPPVLPTVKEEVDHSFIEGGGADTSLKEVGKAPKPRALG